MENILASNKLFKILYILNLLIIILILLFPIIENIFTYKKITTKDIGLPLLGSILILSVSFCVTFLLLNIWGIKVKKNKPMFGIIILILLVWIIWGGYYLIKGVFP